MLAALSAIFEPQAFTPHGFCLLWEPGLIWLQAASDGLIGLAYFSIPLVLLSYVRRRPDVDFGWVIWLFGGFILACGTTHFLSILTLWQPLYWLEGIVKLITAIISVGAAVVLWPLLPRLLALPSPRQLNLVNQQLSQQIVERDRNAVILQEREAQLRRSQKMEGLGQLAGGIAHDFNNVLQVVSGGLNLIRRRAQDAGAVEQLSGMILDSVERGAAITGRLLSFAHQGELKAENLAPQAFLEELSEVLAHTLSTDIVVRTQTEPGLPLLLADKAQLETVILNLALNARDAMPDGGTLELSADLETVADGSAHVAGLAAGRYVRLAATDTGGGMSAATLARAGEPFFTTKPVGQGTGLGLAMARGFAEQSGGGLAIESDLSSGTRVMIWLPVASGGLSRSSPVQPVARTMDGPARARVMVVDDNTMVRDVLAQHLEDRGCEVMRASDGLDALAMLDDGQVIDVLVTDFAMPGMNGLLLIEAARKRQPRLPAVLLTGFADAGVQTRMAESTDNSLVLLRKPVTADDLVARVAVLLDARFDLA